jgi:hypothetical protein
MYPPRKLLDACVRLADEVSPEALDLIVDALETSQLDSCRSRLSSGAWQRCAEMLRIWKDDTPAVPSSELASMLFGAGHAVSHLCQR